VSTAYWSLLFCRPREGAFGQEPYPDPFQGQRAGAAGPAPVQRVSGELKEDLAREGVLTGMQRLELTQELECLRIPG
jgi:hypothetical protein